MPPRPTRPALRRLGLAVSLAWLLGAVLAPGALGDGHGDPGRTPSPEGAELYFITPADGDVVKSPFTVRFGLRGMGVAPATVEKPNTGHHHLLVDTELPDYRVPIPANHHFRHFGGGETEMELELPPGPHTLQLVLGDFRHIPHEPPVVSPRIEITVEE